MSKFLFTEEEAEQLEEVSHKPDQTLAELFNQQVEAFYRLPDKREARKEVYFTPSSCSKCLRELYYENVNAPRDEEPQVPWKKRVPRNGTGVHEVFQQDLAKMEERLREAGHPVFFRLLDCEIKAERSFKVGKYIVKLKGRADGQLGLLDEEGNVVKEIGWEFKTKFQRKALNKVIKAGEPQYAHQMQATAYYLLFGLKDWIFSYESLQKPDWKEDEPEKPDLVHFYFEVNPVEAKNLLRRLAKVVEAVEKQEPPEPELDKCSFCPFKNQCAKDGGTRDERDSSCE